MDKTVDKDEWGDPVNERYIRLGAKDREEGIYVRFEPGFGLNVIVGFRKKIYLGEYGRGSVEYKDFEDDGLKMSIDGWQKIGQLFKEWECREAQFRDQDRASLALVSENPTNVYIPMGLSQAILEALEEGNFLNLHGELLREVQKVGTDD